MNTTLETQRLHRRLRSILDSMHYVVVSFSFDEKAETAVARDAAFYDRHLVEINPAAEALYGVAREEFLSKRKSIFDYVHEQDKVTVLHHYQNLHKEGIGEVIYRITRADNEDVWVLDHGKVEFRERRRVRRITRVIHDITEKKRAEDELKASENKYRRVFERSKDMIFILEPDGSFIDINPAGIELLGLTSKEEAAFRNLKEFHVDPEVRDGLAREMLEKGEATCGRVMLRNDRGEVIEADLNAIARRDRGGKVVSYQGIVTNITEALRQQELESIGQLAGCFADDLASPLNVILVSLSAIEDFLSDLRKIVDGYLQVEEATDKDEVFKKINQHLELIAEFRDEGNTACKEIASRLKEIREEYWRLRKVSDGTGGILYERHSRGAREGSGRTGAARYARN